EQWIGFYKKGSGRPSITWQRRMRPAGLEAFARRVGARSGIYAYEQRGNHTFTPEFEKLFRAHEQSWGFFQGQPASDKKTAMWWVMSAKKEPTRRRRLTHLIEDAAAGRRIREPRRESKS
ncbi:MAG: YdeI/OmpD-associated family protein, partial [Chthoniobacterales bacterium]